MNLCGCFDVFTRRVEGADEHERRGPEGSTGVGMGSGESRSSVVRSVYLCRCWMARRGLGVRVGARSGAEGKEGQHVQKSVVVAS